MFVLILENTSIRLSTANMYITDLRDEDIEISVKVCELIIEILI